MPTDDDMGILLASPAKSTECSSSENDNTSHEGLLTPSKPKSEDEEKSPKQSPRSNANDSRGGSSSAPSAPEGDCPICRDPLENAALKITNCNHLFHQDCVVEWERYNQAQSRSVVLCPYCRQQIDAAQIRRIPNLPGLPQGYSSVVSPNGWTAFAEKGGAADTEVADARFTVQTPDGEVGEASFFISVPMRNFTLDNIQAILDVISIRPRFNLTSGLARWESDPFDSEYYEIFEFLDEDVSQETREEVRHRLRQTDLGFLRWQGDPDLDPVSDHVQNELTGP